MKSWEEEKIDPPSKEMIDKIKADWDSVAKPLDSLGRFETITARIGGILKEEKIDLKKKALLILCADNGIVEEGVSRADQSVTRIMAQAMGQHKTVVCKMAKEVGVDIFPVDVGICYDKTIEGVEYKKIASGTGNFLKEPAMTKEEVEAAIELGIGLVKRCKEEGYKIIATGEMGIGNTTTSSCMAAAMLGGDPLEYIGRGAGSDDEGLNRKKRIIKEALETYKFNKKETKRILQSVGGLDIAAMAGVFIGGAIYKLPVAIDGVISSVAALTANRLKDGVKDYMIPSHLSREPAAKKIMEELELEPVLDASLALGEGTGAVMMLGILDTILAVLNEKTTFEDLLIDQYERC